MVVSCHVVARNQTQVFYKSTDCPYSPYIPSSAWKALWILDYITSLVGQSTLTLPPSCKFLYDIIITLLFGFSVLDTESRISHIGPGAV